MTLLTRERIHRLLQTQSGPCVSIYIPTHREHPGTEQDPIRFKNALKEAARLLSTEHSEPEIRALLDPVAALASAEFWRHQSEGLAVLRSGDVLDEWRLPLRVAELVVVADSFHVRPLLRSLHARERYHVLAISQKGVTLSEGSAEGLKMLEVPGLPAGPLASHPGRRRPAMAGHGATDAPDEATGVPLADLPGSVTDEALLSYLRAIDHAVSRFLRQDPAPVILACVDHYVPLYRRVTRLKQLAHDAVSGSPDAMKPQDIHARVASVAREIHEAGLAKAQEQYWRASKRGRTREGLDDVLREAEQGRVRQLFLARGVHVWGTVDPVTRTIQRSDAQQGSHDDDVLDDIAQWVYQFGGEVRTLPRESMPNAVEAAAELR